MKRRISCMLAAPSMFVMASVAAAQPSDANSPDPAAQAQAANEGAQAAGSEEIVITARRRAESLQDVPQTVNAVSGDTIEKLNIQRFEDIQAVVPGLTLASGSTGYTTTASMRGATFDVNTSASPTVGFYLNEAPVESNQVFQSMFDVGQIEVLRGPQGTLRGRSAPSGAITVTTRRPDMSEAGGYVNMTGTSHGGINLNAGVGAPIINDVLAFRIAGIFDHNDYDGVRSVNNPTDPESRTGAIRASLRFEPTDRISATLTYQHLRRRLHAFTQVTGTGAPGGIVPAYTAVGSFVYPAQPAPPAGYNGPPIAPEDRLAVQEGARDVDQKYDIATANIDWRFVGQKLSYVGSWTGGDVRALSPDDIFNFYRGERYQDLHNVTDGWTHELRLSSENQIANIFDYLLGAYYQKSKVDVFVVQSSINPGAFGDPRRPPVPSQPNPAFIHPLVIARDLKASELSFFGTLTAHLGERTELSVGGRYIINKFRANGPFAEDITGAPGAPTAAQIIGTGTTICLGQALAALPLGAPPPAFPVSIPIGPLCLAGTADTTPNKATPFVWNASASHHFSDDLMVYATAGTAWRDGPFSVVTGRLSAPGFVSSEDLRFHDPEKSRSIEIGVKSTFFNKRGRLNVALYQQKFKNYFLFLPNTYFLTFSGAGVPNGVSTFGFTASADAKVKGIDVDAAFQITPHWNVMGAASWTNGKVANDAIPCNDSNFDGVPDAGVPTVAGFVGAGVITARCVSNRSISRSPRWNLSLQSEYSAPISTNVDAFIRGLFTYYPENPNQADNVVIDNYAILNLYAGIRSPDNAWELSVFAKNALKASQIVALDPTENRSTFFGLAGYNTVGFTPRREIGVNLRYAFGSR